MKSSNEMPIRVRNLRKEQFEIEIEVLERVGHLLVVKWDSDTAKIEVESLMNQREQVLIELDKLNQ